MSQWGGGGMHQVGVQLDVGILSLSHRVSTHLTQPLVHGGGLGEKVQNTKGGNPEAEFPPQSCGRGLPPHVRLARRDAQVKVNYLRGGVEGCCPCHYILHRKCPRLVCRLLHLLVGDGEGLVLRQGVGSSIGAGLQGGKLGHGLLIHGQREY